MAKNTVMGRAVAHAPFNYLGGHPDYPQMIKGQRVRLCVVEDGLTLVEKPSGILSSEKVLLHIPREQLREVRDISGGINIGVLAEAFIEGVFEVSGTTHTAKFQASGIYKVPDGVKIASAAQHLIRGY